MSCTQDIPCPRCTRTASVADCHSIGEEYAVFHVQCSCGYDGPAVEWGYQPTRCGKCGVSVSSDKVLCWGCAAQNEAA